MSEEAIKTDVKPEFKPDGKPLMVSWTLSPNCTTLTYSEKQVLGRRFCLTPTPCGRRSTQQECLYRE